MGITLKTLVFHLKGCLLFDNKTVPIGVVSACSGDLNIEQSRSSLCRLSDVQPDESCGYHKSNASECSSAAQSDDKITHISLTASENKCKLYRPTVHLRKVACPSLTLAKLVAWHSGRTSVFGRRTFSVLCETYS